MNSTPATTTSRAIRTPRAAAVAGIIFSLLSATSVVLIEWALPSGSLDTRLELVPRWLALLGYATAAVLLLGVGLVPGKRRGPLLKAQCA